jgi:hypothetical protein
VIAPIVSHNDFIAQMALLERTNGQGFVIGIVFDQQDESVTHLNLLWGLR